MEVEDTSVTQLEAAIAESLEDVVRRAEQLQQHLVDLPGPSRLIQPGDVGSPERLRALALGTPYEQMRVASAGSTYYGAISDELVYDELAAEPYGDDEGVRSAEATWIGPELGNRAIANYRGALRYPSEQQLRKRAGDEALDDGGRGDKRFALLVSQADAATARANAACDVLELLMLRTHAVEGGGRGGSTFGGGAHGGGAYGGGAFGRGAGRASGGERSAAWISQCKAKLLTWVDTQKKLCAESDLRALQLDAQLRGERTDAAAALERERGRAERRAERAEGRSRQLVHELRSVHKGIVDGVEGATGGFAPPPPPESPPLPSQCARARADRWEREREAADGAAKSEQHVAVVRRQTLAHQLALPRMSAQLFVEASARSRNRG